MLMSFTTNVANYRVNALTIQRPLTNARKRLGNYKSNWVTPGAAGG